MPNKNIATIAATHYIFRVGPEEIYAFYCSTISVWVQKKRSAYIRYILFEIFAVSLGLPVTSVPVCVCSGCSLCCIE